MELRIINNTKYPMGHILTEINKNIHVEGLEEQEDYDIETCYGLKLNVFRFGGTGEENYIAVTASSDSSNWKQDLV